MTSNLDQINAVLFARGFAVAPGTDKRWRLLIDADTIISVEMVYEGGDHRIEKWHWTKEGWSFVERAFFQHADGLRMAIGQFCR